MDMTPKQRAEADLAKRMRLSEGAPMGNQNAAGPHNGSGGGSGKGSSSSSGKSSGKVITSDKAKAMVSAIKDKLWGSNSFAQSLSNSDHKFIKDLSARLQSYGMPVGGPTAERLNAIHAKMGK